MTFSRLAPWKLALPSAKLLPVLATTVGITTTVAAASANAVIVDQPVRHSGTDTVVLNPIGAYDSGVFDASAAEIVAYHPDTTSVLVVNANAGTVDVLSVADPTHPQLRGTVSVPGHEVNSVSVREDGLVVAAAEPSEDKTLPGKAVFFDIAHLEDGLLGDVTVGSLPDNVQITPDGRFALVANEGEPAEDYSVDPEGSVSVIALPPTPTSPTQDAVRTADFTAWNDYSADELWKDNNIRVFGPQEKLLASENFEPEYIAISGNLAFASLQENNAIAVIDIEKAQVIDVFGLGVIDRETVAFDPSDKDDAVTLRTAPVKALPLPDALAAFEHDGKTYIITTNEGDARDWDGYSEEIRFGDIGDPEETDIVLGANLDPALQKKDALGRLKITTAQGVKTNPDGTRELTEIYTFGGRGFSIYDSEGNLISTSGTDFERIQMEAHPDFFNTDHAETKLESRSDDKGPEPEAVTVARLNDRLYAFIGNERVGGVMVYDVTDPAKPQYVSYVNNRDFSVSMEDVDEASVPSALAKAGDLGPEGIHYVSPADSPNNRPLVIVGNEVSGTTTVFEATGADADAEAARPTPGDTTPDNPDTSKPAEPLSSAAQLGSSVAVGSSVTPATDGTETDGTATDEVTSAAADLAGLVLGSSVRF
ncbi:choice-of-anchor I family protein [Corynebacterium uterequi]|uniref:Choice-of-anchor I domain-containing protein n=1 Tax=Corynebacterium uterequi TaxID=1072256 RepID=A0A0G3HHK9_9CORY|nr:choice-of-anchor I family protein [Corynebacterium uterequi]AKK10617.1 hypothetical protein CUTER_03025 [Corynebacterium uterequi]